MTSELTITVKDDAKKLVQKHHLYEPYCVIPEDPVIKNCVEQAVKAFDGIPDSIKIRIHMDIE